MKPRLTLVYLIKQKHVLIHIISIMCTIQKVGIYYKFNQIELTNPKKIKLFEYFSTEMGLFNFKPT